MSDTPFMPLKISDFIADTIDMDATETGAYLMLIMAQWKWGGQSLPDDMAKLARMARCTRNWTRVWASISVHFERDEAGWFNPKGREVFAGVRAKSTANANNGALGGKARALRIKKSSVANATDSLYQPEPEQEIVKREANASQKKGARLASDWLLPSIWGQWAMSEGMTEAQVRAEADKFRDYWVSKAGAGGVKLDWQATWRNWVRNAKGKHENGKPDGKGERFLRSFLAGASVAPGVGAGEDRDPSQPLLARG